MPSQQATNVAAQGQERNYAFHTLGWYQFERLCRTILCDLLGQTVEIYASGNDAGQDAVFSGTWTQIGAEELTGTFTFQVKYSRYPHSPLTESVMSHEVEKARRLAKEGLLDNYLVITNHLVTGERQLTLSKRLCELTGAKTVKIYGADWLSHLITESSHLRMLVPRVYGLGDLGEILDQRAYDQAKAILSWMPALKTIVTTASMQEAARTLRAHRFVLIVGDAMVGKTTAASSLAIAALDDLKLRVLKVRSADAFVEHWNANRDAKQFFWIDDAFGETSFDEELTRSWSRNLDALAAAHEAGASFVLTSRSYIWHRARELIKTYSFEHLRTGKVVIDLRDLSDIERRQILYNHVRMGDQQAEFKTRLEPLLPAVAKIEPFYPEAARRLANSHFTHNLQLDPDGLKIFFEKPLDILIDIVTRLSAPEKALLALIFANSGRLEAPITYDERASRIVRLFGAQSHEVSNLVASLEDVFIKRVTDLDGSVTYRFTHPSFGDAIARMTASRTEWLEVYLAGASTMSILHETHAGVPGEAGVEIAVPPARYDDVVARIRELITDRAKSGTYWTTYVANRCGALFLSYLSEHLPEAFDEQYYYDEEWDPKDDDYLKLCVRLCQNEILSEDMRSRAVARMRNYLSYDLGYFLDGVFDALLLPAERAQIFETLHSRANDLIDSMIDRYDEVYSRGDDASGFYSTALDYIDELERACEGNEKVAAECASARQRLWNKIGELEVENRERSLTRTQADRVFQFATEASSVAAGEAEVRNIFSDVADPL